MRVRRRWHTENSATLSATVDSAVSGWWPKMNEGAFGRRTPKRPAPKPPMEYPWRCPLVTQPPVSPQGLDFAKNLNIRLIDEEEDSPPPLPTILAEFRREAQSDDGQETAGQQNSDLGVCPISLESLEGPKLAGDPQTCVLSGSVFPHPQWGAPHAVSTSQDPKRDDHSNEVVRPCSKLTMQTWAAGLQPLDHLSEEEEEGEDEDVPSTSEDYDVRDIMGHQPYLRRTDSIVTVAHLYEDLMVSSRFRFKVTLTNLTILVVIAAITVPNTAVLLYSIFRLVFGTLFPAYYSYKAVRTKDVKEYVKWMMYWIVFAFFTCIETITDLFLSFWFPFYYEIKILLVLWLLSPATKGSSILYRKFVHPWLTKREVEIDECIAKAKQRGYSTVVQLGSKSVNYATNVLMQTAIRGGGGLMNHLRRSYSTGEICDGDMNQNIKALPSSEDGTSTGRHIFNEIDGAYRRRGSSTGRLSRTYKTRSADVMDLLEPEIEGEDEATVPCRRSPRSQDSSKYHHMQHYQESPPKGHLLKRGKSETRKSSKSLINSADVNKAVDWAKAQRVSSTLSLASELEFCDSSEQVSTITRPSTRYGGRGKPKKISKGQSRKLPGSTLEAGSDSE